MTRLDQGQDVLDFEVVSRHQEPGDLCLVPGEDVVEQAGVVPQARLEGVHGRRLATAVAGRAAQHDVLDGVRPFRVDVVEGGVAARSDDGVAIGALPRGEVADLVGALKYRGSAGTITTLGAA